MTDLAIKDERVKGQLAEERKAQAEKEFRDADWQKALELEKTGAVKDSFEIIFDIKQ